MKKIVLLMAAMLAFAPIVSFAATLDYDTGVLELGSGNNMLEISTSNSVSLAYDASTGGATYSIATYHDKGDRTYLSSSEDANIYWGKGAAVKMIDAPAVGTSLGSTQTGFDKTL